MKQVFNDCQDKMKKSVDSMLHEFSQLKAGRANPAILDKITVEYYGTATPIPQIGSISVPEARTLVVQPWDASILGEIEKAILASDLGINPNNDGKVIRLVFPQLTEERRRDLSKSVQKMGEEGKVAIRNIRRDANDAIKKMKKEGTITEDEIKTSEKEVQDVTDKYIKQIDAIVTAKEKEIMHI